MSGLGAIVLQAMVLLLWHALQLMDFIVLQPTPGKVLMGYSLEKIHHCFFLVLVILNVLSKLETMLCAGSLLCLVSV